MKRGEVVYHRIDKAMGHCSGRALAMVPYFRVDRNMFFGAHSMYHFYS